MLTIRIWLWRARPVLVALGLAILVLGAARIAAPPAPATETVVVLARDVAAGAALTPGDLVAVALPAGQAPAGASRTAGDWVGRRTVVALPAGLPLVPGLLAGSRFTVTPPAGSVVVAVPLDGTGALRPGDRVDLVPTGCADEPAATQLSGALVVEVEDGQVLVATDRVSATHLVTMVEICAVVALLVE